MISVIVVDIVTTRTGYLHNGLLALLRCGDGDPSDAPDLHAAAYRMRPAAPDHELDIWYEALGVGRTFPVLPLWLNATDAVPVDLATSYDATCQSLRIDASF